MGQPSHLFPKAAAASLSTTSAPWVDGPSSRPPACRAFSLFRSWFASKSRVGYVVIGELAVYRILLFGAAVLTIALDIRVLCVGATSVQDLWCPAPGIR
jgi:hypothetical protein